jgi:hypothetical protein
MKVINLNQRALAPALKNPRIILRIEDCILKARTELSKRRLFKTAIALSVIAAANISINDGPEESFIKLTGDVLI